jgi:hypothetical protein
VKDGVLRLYIVRRGRRRLSCSDLVMEKASRMETKGDVRLPIQMFYDSSTRKEMM